MMSASQSRHLAATEELKVRDALEVIRRFAYSRPDVTESDLKKIFDAEHCVVDLLRRTQ